MRPTSFRALFRYVTSPALLDQPDNDFHRGLLHGALERTAALLALVHEQAERQAEHARQHAAPPPDLTAATLSFERMARTLRRTIAFARHIAQPPRSTAQRTAPWPAHAPARTAARKRVIRGVEDAIQHGAESDGHAERLYEEFRERLDSPEFEHELDRPAGELIQEVVRDLDLAAAQRDGYPWRRRTPADAAALHAWAAAPPGTPAAELPTLRPPRARGHDVPNHPDDLVELRLLSDAQIEAGCKRQLARQQARARERGSG